MPNLSGAGLRYDGAVAKLASGAGATVEEGAALATCENLSYVVGVNRVGTDGNGLHYSGDNGD